VLVGFNSSFAFFSRCWYIIFAFQLVFCAMESTLLGQARNSVRMAHNFAVTPGVPAHQIAAAVASATRRLALARTYPHYSAVALKALTDLEAIVGDLARLEDADDVDSAYQRAGLGICDCVLDPAAAQQ